MSTSKQVSVKFWADDCGQPGVRKGLYYQHWQHTSAAEKEYFFTENYSLAVVDGPSLSCVQNLATSEQPGTECALQLTPVTLIEASDSKFFVNCELLKLSSHANTLL